MSLLDKLSQTKTSQRSPLPVSSQAPPTEVSLIGLTARYLFDAHTGLMVVDTDGKIVLLNSQLEQMSGWMADVATGLGQEIVLKLEDKNKLDPLPKLWGSLSSEGTAQSQSELTLTSKTKELYRVEVTATPLRISGGQVAGYLWEISDLNEKRKVERMQDEFVSTVSHELRTPMTAIEGYLSLILSDREHLDEKLRGYLIKTHAAALQMSQLLQTLLTITDIDLGTSQAIVKRLIDLEPIIQSIIKRYGSEAEVSGISLNFSVETVGNVVLKIPAVYGDEKRINEILEQVVSNSFKFTPKGGRIDLSLETSPEFVTIVVKDTGSGIPSEALPHIFERFYQIDGGLAKEHNGMGVGLFVTKSLIESIDGQIEITSVPGRGTNVYLKFARA